MTPISTRTLSAPSVSRLLSACSFEPPSSLRPEEDSPYPEVRSAVANTDDPDMPVNTIRAWAIGLAWSILIPGMNQFFYFRYPSVTVGGVRISTPTTLGYTLIESRFGYAPFRLSLSCSPSRSGVSGRASCPT